MKEGNLIIIKSLLFNTSLIILYAALKLSMLPDVKLGMAERYLIHITQD